MGAMAVGGVDGDVQAAVAHHLLGAGEASAVAELGPHRHGDQPADAVVGLDQRPARRLAMTEALQVPLQRLRLDVGGLEHRVADPHPLPAGRGQVDLVAEQPVPGGRRADRRLGHGDAVLEQLGVDPLDPHPSLIDQRLVEPHPFAPLQHDRRRDPRLGQIAGLQQLAQQPGVGTIGLGVPLAAPRRLRVGRLRQVRLEPGGDDLLDHVPPTGAALHRHRHRLPVGATSDVVAQPAPEPFPVGLPHPAPPHLPRLRLHRVEGDLLTMQIQATYHAHRGPPCSSSSS